MAGSSREMSTLLDTLRDHYGHFPMDYCRYKQLHNFVHSLVPKIHPLSTPTPLEKLCITGDSVPHSILVLYKLLQSEETTRKPLYIWE